MHDNELKTIQAIQSEQVKFFERVGKAIDRIRLDPGFSVEFFVEDDEVQVMFGDIPDFYITQATGQLQIHVDPDTNDIVGITLKGISSTPQSDFGRTLIQLGRYGKVHISPEKQGAELMAHDIKELVEA